MTEEIQANPEPAGAGLTIKPDLRQSQAALDICRGVQRLFIGLGFSCVCELSLANGRRADVVALGQRGEISMVEIKSSLEDFRADHKWHEYLEYCDRLYFAVKPDCPADVLPEDCGLIFADRYGAEVIRDSPEIKLPGSRRKAVTMRFARAAALRLSLAIDPGLSTLLKEGA